MTFYLSLVIYLEDKIWTQINPGQNFNHLKNEAAFKRSFIKGYLLN